MHAVILLFFLWNLKVHAPAFYYVFSNFIYFDPKLKLYNFIYMALYSL